MPARRQNLDVRTSLLRNGPGGECDTVFGISFLLVSKFALIPIYVQTITIVGNSTIFLRLNFMRRFASFCCPVLHAGLSGDFGRCCSLLLAAWSLDVLSRAALVFCPPRKDEAYRSEGLEAAWCDVVAGRHG